MGGQSRMATATETYRYSRLHIRYFDKEVQAVAIGRTVYFPLRALCKEIGIAPQMQIERIRGDGRFPPETLREVPIPTIKGQRDAICIRKQEVGKWLASLDPARCALGAATRADLERFQRELFDAADRFLFGDTSVSVYDAATKTAMPVTGTLHVGHCPGCGMALCLTFDADGAHLAPDEAEGEGE